jgi:CIC family chloride channel protein
VPSSPAPFVIVTMMALFGGIAHAPLAVMLMVGEMTGNLSLLAPAMIAVGIATALVGDATIYRSQLPNRASSPAHRVRFSFPLLSALLVRDAMGPPPPTVPAAAPLSVAESLLDHGATNHVVVVQKPDGSIGVLTRERLERVPPAAWATTPSESVLPKTVVCLTPDQPLDTALEQLAEVGASEAPVLERGQLVGQVHERDILATYKASLERSVRRARALPAGTSLFEARLSAASPLACRTLQEAGLPKDSLVVSVIRDGEMIFPRAATRLEAGDVVLVMATPASEVTLREFLEGTPASV